MKTPNPVLAKTKIFAALTVGALSIFLIRSMAEKFDSITSSPSPAPTSVTPSSPTRAERVAQLEPRAHAGDAEAQFHLAEVYDDPNDHATPEDSRLALEWYEKAAAQGHEKAAGHAGYLILNGLAGPADHARAMRWLEPIANKGDAWAATMIATSYDRGQGVAPAPAKAATWYRRAAEGGSAHAMFRLGYFYTNAMGVPCDLAEAARWFRAGDAKDNSPSRACLGALYFYGAGVEQDYAQSAAWFRKAQASPGGNTWSPYMLGVMAENGLGTKRDLDAAAALYTTAASGPNGYYSAKIRCNLLHAAGRNEIPHFDVDLQWLAPGAEKGSSLSQYLFGLSHRDGVGMEKNPVEALHWLILAAEPFQVSAAEARDKLRGELTPAQIEQAEKLAAATREGLKGKTEPMF